LPLNRVHPRCAGIRLRLDTADRLEREGMAALADEVLPKMLASDTIANRPALAQFVRAMMRHAPRADAEQMHALLRGSRMVWMPGVGHMPNLECAEAFNEELAAFLETPELRRRRSVSAAEAADEVAQTREATGVTGLRHR
jgi:pimeloyl-ACP methyl ester carboxylesterase